MIIGVPREIRVHEYRVALTPSGVQELYKEGHSIFIERSAGLGSGFEDSAYEEAGAAVANRDEVFSKAKLIVKVKEPQPQEFDLLKPEHILFTYLHLAPNRALTDVLLEKRLTALGYETLEDGGILPLLVPMSEIAGRMSPLVGAFYLQKALNGSGILPTGTTGVPPARAAVIGAGVVGSNAARVAHALGMQVTVLNRGVEKLRHLDQVYQGKITTLPSTTENISEAVSTADVVVGAVLLSGKTAPTCVREEDVRNMRDGSVIVDVAIDQGGCVATSRPTTHDHPVYEMHGITHYCVANMPGAYPRTSTLALTNSTLPYIKRLAALGSEAALDNDPILLSAVNIRKGMVVHNGLASSLGLSFGAA